MNIPVAQNKTVKILEFLEDKMYEAADLVVLMLSLKPGMSVAKIERLRDEMEAARGKGKVERSEKRRLQILISKLKSDGLISETVSGQRKTLTLSKAGQKKLERNKNRQFAKDYKKEAGTETIIISYDVPEKFKREREILRELLKIMGFKMVHKSVWVGKVKLPESFIEDLRRMKIIDYVEILMVTRKGSLKEIS